MYVMLLVMTFKCQCPVNAGMPISLPDKILKCTYGYKVMGGGGGGGGATPVITEI